LIDPATGPLGQVRQGGDEGGGGRGLPVVPIRILALFSGPVKLDADGSARIPLQLPDFNGEVRLMAVAFDRSRVGRGEGKLVVRDPWWRSSACPASRTGTGPRDPVRGKWTARRGPCAP
jgi:uncharacterized protein YfaS (alpha-2-macroglobulin family)